MILISSDRKLEGSMILAMLILFLVAAAGCSGDSGSGGRDTKPAELTILFSNDLLGMIRSCGCTVEDTGGLARRTTYVKNMRKSLHNMIVIDAGDAFSLDLGYTQNEAALTIESFGLMGMDVFTPGEMEFIFGLPFIQNLAENSGVDFVAANVVFEETGEPVFGKRYVIRELKGGLRVGITGVLDDAVRFPGYIDRSAFRIDPAEETLEDVVIEMKKEADFLILISHMDKERTGDILTRIDDFEVALIGHGKPSIKGEEKVGRTILVGTAGEGRYIGNLRVNIQADGRYSQATLKQVQLTSKEFAMDPGVKELFHLYDLPLTDKELKKTGRSTAETKKEGRK